jgi:TonB-dependent Receptor Plug Domain
VAEPIAGSETKPTDTSDFAAVQSLDPRAADVGVAQSASQGVVVPAQLLAQPVYRTGELLEAMPGLIVTQHSGEGKANQYFLRGFNLDHGRISRSPSTACRPTCARMATGRAMPIPTS